MLCSFLVMLLCGFAAGGIMKRLNLPAMSGMMAAGMLLYTYCLNIIALAQ